LSCSHEMKFASDPKRALRMYICRKRFADADDSCL